MSNQSANTQNNDASLRGVSLPIAITSTIIDTLGGQTLYERVWQAKPSAEYIKYHCYSAAVRSEVSRFFLSHRMVEILDSDLIRVRTVRPDNVTIRPDVLFERISSVKGLTPSAALVVMEFVNAYLIQLGVVSDVTSDRVAPITYSRATVDLDKLITDSSIQEVVRIFESVTIVKIKDRVYTPQTFAQEVSSALLPLGRAFLDINDYSSIFSDIVRGIRAFIEPELVDLLGTVKPYWRDHPVVRQLAENAVFVEAAVSLPAGYSITPVNTDYRLETYAPVVLSALKTSKRYQFVDRSHIAKHYVSRKIRNRAGVVCGAIIGHNVRMMPAAQALHSTTDARSKDATMISGTRERAAEAIVAAYAGVPETVSVYSAVNTALSVLTDIAEASNGEHIGVVRYQVDEVVPMTDLHMAMLLSDSMTVTVAGSSNAVSVSGPGATAVHIAEWVFTVPTTERDFIFEEGSKALLLNDRVVTSSADEVLMVASQLDGAVTVALPQQTIPNELLDLSFIGFDFRKATSRLNTKMEFKLNHGDTMYEGSIRPMDLGRLMTNQSVSLYTPVYNDKVCQSFFDSLNELDQKVNKTLLDDSGTGRDHSGLRRALATRIMRARLNAAYSLDPSFIAEVSKTLVAVMTSQITPEDADQMRASFRQSMYRVDLAVYAFIFFLRAQGIDYESFQLALELHKDVYEEVRREGFPDSKGRSLASI